MAAGRRPGGLTALAVLNFVYAGWSMLNVLGAVAIIAFSGAMKEAVKTAEERQMMESLDSMNMGVWGVLIGSGVLAMILLIAAGVGYLKMRKWGRTSGNLFAITAIAAGIAGAFLTPSDLGGGLSIATIIGLVYPVLTLYFINVTFKDDLVS